MADESVIVGSAPRTGWSRLPAAVRVGAIYVSARLITTVFLLIAAAMSGPASRFGADASIGDLAVGWDAQWYWFTALNGYPAMLPLTDSGQVAENSWAFMPIYAYVAQAIGAPFGSWIFGAVAISAVSGYLACLVLYRMLRMRLDAAAATWSVGLFANAPLAAMFQVGYAESLFLLLLLLSLWMVMRRQYGWLYLLIPLMGYTRPGVLAFALFLGLFGVHRWLRRRSDALRPREIAHIIALGALAVAVGFSWQLIAAAVTGDSGAYLATELAWRRNWLTEASGSFVPFEGFVMAAAFWFGSWGLGAISGYVALSVGVAGVAAFLLFEPHVKRLGVEVRLWTAAYLVYLLAVFFPQSSIFRLLFPVSPLWGALAAPESKSWRFGVLGVALLGQWWWTYNMYALGNTYWQIP